MKIQSRLFTFLLFCLSITKGFAATEGNIQGPEGEVSTAQDRATDFLEQYYSRELSDDSVLELIQQGLQAGFIIDEMPVIFWAVRVLSAKGLEHFSGQEIPITLSTRWGETLLSRALKWSKNDEDQYKKAKLIIEKWHADPNMHGRIGFRNMDGILGSEQAWKGEKSDAPIHCVRGIKTLNLLLEHGARINTEGEAYEGIAFTPLFSAIHQGHLDVVKALLAMGAKLQNIAGDRACDIKCKNPKTAHLIFGLIEMTMTPYSS